MDEEERLKLVKAMNRAIDTFEKELSDWNFTPPVRLEVRDLREGDMTLGESIVIDQIKEFLEQRDRRKNG